MGRARQQSSPASAKVDGVIEVPTGGRNKTTFARKLAPAPITVNDAIASVPSSAPVAVTGLVAAAKSPRARGKAVKKDITADAGTNAHVAAHVSAVTPSAQPSVMPQRAPATKGRPPARRRRERSESSHDTSESDIAMTASDDSDAEASRAMEKPKGRAGRKSAKKEAAKTELSSYEESRMRTIQENNDFLKQLGLHETKAHLSASAVPSSRSPGNRHYVMKSKAVETSVRKSRRLGGLEAEYESIDESDADEVDAGNVRPEDPATAASAERGFYTKCLWMGRKQTTNFVLSDRLPKRIALPLTLCSIGTTVWELGAIHTGENKDNYWSNHQCLFKHPYPVGYRASKEHFGHLYHMHILEGPSGPIFRVQQVNGPTWTGHTPTQPWTGACLASKSPGTRVSGPLFFGFSDPIVQRLIELMPNFEKPIVRRKGRDTDNTAEGAEGAEGGD